MAKTEEETRQELKAKFEEEDQRRRLEFKRKRVQMMRERRFKGSVFEPPTGEPNARELIAAENLPETPLILGAGKAFTDFWRNAEALAQKQIAKLPAGPGTAAAKAGARDRLIKLSRDAEESQAVFNELARYRPGAKVGNFFATLGLAFLIPGGREKTALQKAKGALTARRRATATSEALAGGVATLAQGQPIEDVEFNTLAGTAVGATIYGILTGVNRAGQLFVGGRPATLQNIDDLRQAEKDLGVTNLLTTGEMRGGRILQKIEGVYDNIPIIGITLAGKREAQQQIYQNAVRRIQAAFPDIGEDQARKLITANLRKNEDIVKGLYKEIADLSEDVPEFIQVQPTHYVQRAQKMLSEELKKGAKANPSVVRELEKAITQGPVDFQTATRISGDLGTEIRVADRAALDPARTGVDAGRKKQLAMAYFRDMETWARQFPESSPIFTKWQEAKEAYKDLVLPFNKRPLAPLFDDAGYDSYALSKAIIDPNKGGQLTKLDPDGALAYLYINNVIEESTKAGKVNIKVLASNLDKVRNRRAFAEINSAIPEESRNMITALVKLVDANPRAFAKDQNILKTTAGFSVAGAAGLAGAAGADNEVTGALGGLATLGFLRWTFTSPLARNILTSASRVPPKNRQQLAELGTRLNLGYQRFVESAVIDQSLDNREVVEEAVEEAVESGLSRAGFGQ